MTQTEREQALWSDAYLAALSSSYGSAKAKENADAALAGFREAFPNDPPAFPNAPLFQADPVKAHVAELLEERPTETQEPTPAAAPKRTKKVRS